MSEGLIRQEGMPRTRPYREAGWAMVVPTGGAREVAARVRGDAPAGEPLWTIGDALAFLDPRPNRRTLARWLARLESPGTRRLPQGGPPARLYRAREVMKLHATWASGDS